MSSYRKMIETTGRLIEQLLPKHIHAVAARSFGLKVAFFVLACSIQLHGSVATRGKYHNGIGIK
jgi:hypothetical protein